jgi:hypothetical protein
MTLGEERTDEYCGNSAKAIGRKHHNEAKEKMLWKNGMHINTQNSK